MISTSDPGHGVVQRKAYNLLRASLDNGITLATPGGILINGLGREEAFLHFNHVISF